MAHGGKYAAYLLRPPVLSCTLRQVGRSRGPARLRRDSVRDAGKGGRMASYMQAVGRYGPRVVQGPHAMEDELVAWMATDAGANPHVVRMVLGQLGRVLRFYLRRGSPVVLPGVGRFRLTMGQDQDLRLSFSLDKDLRKDLRDRRAFVGRTEFTERSRWTPQQYKARWDAEFPDDPLELPASDTDSPTARRRARRGAAWGGLRRPGDVGSGTAETLPTPDRSDDGGLINGGRHAPRS